MSDLKDCVTTINKLLTDPSNLGLSDQIRTLSTNLQIITIQLNEN